MTTQRHAPTEAPLKGFEARLQVAFEWISAHPREVLGTLITLLIAGAVVAAVYEWRGRQEEAASQALARAERVFAERMGGDPSRALVSEPANSDQARATRAEALPLFEEVAAKHAASRAAEMALLRAAEIEIDLGETEAAQARLEALIGELGEDDALRGIALRLLAHAQTLRGDYRAAADSLAAGAEVESYPDRGLMWLEAGRNFERVQDLQAALQAYDAALATDPVFAERAGLVERSAALEARLAAEAMPPPEPPQEFR